MPQIMINQDKNGLRLPVVFTYKNRILAFILICLFSFGFLGITLFAISHGIGFGLGLFMTFLALFLLVVSGVAILGQSEVVIDDQGISRRLFGRTWRTIRWDNVKIIKSFHVAELGFRSRIIRAFSIFPTVEPAGMSYLRGRIGFTENFVNIDQLIELINHYVSKYGIEIESQANGVKTKVTHL